MLTFMSRKKQTNTVTVTVTVSRELFVYKSTQSGLVRVKEFYKDYEVLLTIRSRRTGSHREAVPWVLQDY
jgi:hypothetical protein